ncbi:MAG TPA: DGQHR domain-containing protein [Chitinophagaceae bacterium]|nr:DGQHR domain-containing protein [Chitinophagaceae bacterium]
MKSSQSKEASFDCIHIKQGKKFELVLFSCEAKRLRKLVEINRRDSDEDKGYQRFLSGSRVNAIKKFVENNNPLPSAILITFDKWRLNSKENIITVPNKKNIGWVIDGQHRLEGANEASINISLPVIAFLGLSQEDQIKQFVVINKEAKGVPTSLYLDLLPHLPNKKPADLAKERSADLGNQLKRDEDSPFFGRIVVTTFPKKGELSLTNFVRLVTPLILPGKGLLSTYTEKEQRLIISNYFKALINVFPSYFKTYDSIFFQTIGFGALIHTLPIFFSICLTNYQGFTAEDATKVFNKVKDFDFSAWSKKGTGTAAELEASEDLKTELISAFEDTKSEGGILKL